MKQKNILRIRTIIALTVLILSITAFMAHFYRIRVFNVQVIPLLQQVLVTFSTFYIALLGILLILTLLFGRIYCSTLCPLGLFQELLTLLFKPFYKKRPFRPMPPSPWRYLLAVILFGTLCGGTVVLLRLVDPYTIFGSAMSGAGYGIGFLLALTVLVFFKKRFFCTSICPVGVFLGVFSRWSLCRLQIDKSKCVGCNVCARSCPAGCINVQEHHIDNETCVRCFKCLAHCPHEALFYGRKPTEVQEIKFNPKRRQLLKSGLILVAFGVAVKGGVFLKNFVEEKVKKAILPAGARNLKSFANRCLNCNLCVAKCPMKVLKPATLEHPFAHLEYNGTFCSYRCHKCSKVCPSGALKKLTLAEKRRTKIGTAVVDTEKCIKCGLCARECPREIIIKERKQYPIIPENKCIGCGMCATVCPGKAIHIEPAEVQRLVD